METIDCKQYKNPFTTPHACMTVVDSLAFLGAFLFVVICIATFVESQKQ